MAYDLHFAARIRQALHGKPIAEKGIIGGIGFMLNGNLVCGIYRDDLILRVAADDLKTLLTKPGAKPFEMRGKTAKGWLLVGSEHIKTDAALKRWVGVALAYAESLPPKAEKKSKARK